MDDIRFYLGKADTNGDDIKYCVNLTTGEAILEDKYCGYRIEEGNEYRVVCVHSVWHIPKNKEIYLERFC